MISKKFSRTLLLAPATAVVAFSGWLFTSFDSKENSKSVIEYKVDSLLSVMTLAEKIGQTNTYNGSWDLTGPSEEDQYPERKAQAIKNGEVGAMLNVLTVKGVKEIQRLAVEETRLGIPLLFGYDAIHGFRTMMPIPLAQAASWDPEVGQVSARVTALEAAAGGINWTFAPMMDINRDSRWGRVMEGAGEDPYLTSQMTRAWIRGFQGDDLSSPSTIAACAKHYAGYGFAVAGRDYNTVDMSGSVLHNVVLPPFKAAVDEGVATIMNSFNELNGVPATGNTYLQRDILKGDWGFDGLVVSDWGSIGEMILHGYASDSSDAALKAMTAGSDMDMESRVYEAYLNDLIEENDLDVKLLDDAVRRILKLKYELGLFDDPYKYCNETREKEITLSQANLDKAREVARETFVLLKNDKGLLPLSKNVKSIGVIGQLADSKDVPIGSWRGYAIPESAVSLLEGIQNATGNNTTVKFASGYTLTKGDRLFAQELDIADGSDKSGFKEAIDLAKNSDYVVMALGEDCFQTGEGRSQTSIELKSNQIELFQEIIKVNKNVIVVLMNGRPIPIPEVAQYAPSILETWHAGSEAGNAIADVIFGDYNPSGKLPVSFPYNTGQEPLYYNVKRTGRSEQLSHVFWSHYTDAPNEALYCFGHGLSYTSFKYRDLKINKANDGLEATLHLKNVGKRQGEEVVQLYIRDISASITRPIKELKGFQKIALNSKEEIEVTFKLSKDDLSFFDNNGTKQFESGEFHVWVGSNSHNPELFAKVEIE